MDTKEIGDKTKPSKINPGQEAFELQNRKKKGKPLINDIKPPNVIKNLIKTEPKKLHNPKTSFKDSLFAKNNITEKLDKVRDIKKTECIKIQDKDEKIDVAKLKFKNKFNDNQNGENTTKNDNCKQIVDIGNIHMSKNEKILVDEESDHDTYNLLDSAEDPDDVRSVWSEEQNPKDGLKSLNCDNVP